MTCSELSLCVILSLKWAGFVARITHFRLNNSRVDHAVLLLTGGAECDSIGICRVVYIQYMWIDEDMKGVRVGVALIYIFLTGKSKKTQGQRAEL